MHFLKNYLIIPCLLFINLLFAQNYQAIHGSSYAGSLGVCSNPASIVNVPYAWDITPFSIQTKQATNAVKITGFSLLSAPSNVKIDFENGNKKRFVFTNQDIHLFNTRISLNSKAAIAFGANIRNYIYVTTSQFNYQDTISSLGNFMKINNGNLPLSGESFTSTWAELYASYAQTILDDGLRILNVGLTIKSHKNIAGGYVKTQGLTFIPETTNNVPGYQLTNGSLEYAYSANFDYIDNNNSSVQNRNLFLQKTYGGLSADLGFEYILSTNNEEEGGGGYAYKTKIGLSILDIGRNKYQYGALSSIATVGGAGLTDTVIANKFLDPASVSNFNDSLASISNSFRQLQRFFNIYQPTRLLINVDQHIANNFFLNAELTIPLISIVKKNAFYVKDMNLLAVTPRWELKSAGVYLPVLFNTQGQLWVGVAFKVGPVLLGTHSISNLFSKNSFQNGGAYLAFTVRPGKKYDKDAHKPADKMSNRTTRNLSCPKF